MAFLVANSFFGLAKETLYGLPPVSGAVYIPVTTPQVTPQQKFLRDEALRGSASLLYDEVQGVRNDEYEAKFYLFPDTFAHLLVGIIGTDTVTGSSAPYTHGIKLINSPSTGSQPASYSLLDFDGANYFLMTGGVASSMKITAGAETAAEGDVKFITNPYTSSTSAPAPFTSLAISTEHMVPGWDCSVTVGGTTGPGGTGGTTLTYITNIEVTLDRKTQPIFTNGQQAPLRNFAGPLDVTGKFTAVVNSNADVWSTGTSAQALTRSPQVLTLNFIDPNDLSSSTPQSINLGMSQVQFMNVKRTRGKEYTEIEVEFNAQGNASDASTGYAPAQAWVVNSASAAY